MLLSSQHKLIGRKTGRWFERRMPDHVAIDTALEGCRDRPGKVVLDLENVDDFSIIAIRPDMIGSNCIDLLGGDADAVGSPPD